MFDGVGNDDGWIYLLYMMEMVYISCYDTL